MSTMMGPRSAVLLVHAGGRRRRRMWIRAVLEQYGAALSAALPPDRSVFCAVRKDGPGIHGAVRRIVAAGFEELVVVPMYPHFGPSTTGVVMRDVYRALGRRGPHLRVEARTAWGDDATYLDALARWVADRARAVGVSPETAVLRFEGCGCGWGGDRTNRYRRAVMQTAHRVAERVGWPASRTCVEFSEASHRPGRPRGEATAPGVIVCALPFPSRPAKVRDESSAEGSRPYVDPSFISALKNIVLRGPRSTRSGAGPSETLLPRRTGAGVSAEKPASLVMIGVSLPGSLRCGRGPRLAYSTREAFARVKRSHGAVRAFLDRLRDEDAVHEALIWNTCQRVEVYSWLRDPGASPGASDPIPRLRGMFFGEEAPGLEVNVLRGVDVRHHLLRTACGLNSDLPGDRDVADQLKTAFRSAQRAGTAGPRATRLVEEAVALAREIHARTSWGDFSAGYCAAALARVCEVDGIRPDELRHVVIGGSTTSRSILSALRHEYDVPEYRMTVVYRDHHGQMKELRRVIGNGRRLRVHSYADARVLRAVGAADMVFFGIDQPEPVVEVGALGTLRDFGAHPLTVVDFNSAGSLSPASGPPPVGVRVWDAGKLDRAVAAHSAITTARAGFSRALERVERLIAGRAAAPESTHRQAGGARPGLPARV